MHLKSNYSRESVLGSSVKVHSAVQWAVVLELFSLGCIWLRGFQLEEGWVHASPPGFQSNGLWQTLPCLAGPGAVAPERSLWLASAVAEVRASSQGLVWWHSGLNLFGCLLPMLEYLLQTWLLHCTPASCWCILGGSRTWAHVFGSLPHSGETQIEFWASGFCFYQSWLTAFEVYLVSEAADKKISSPFLFQVDKNKHE